MKTQQSNPYFFVADEEAGRSWLSTSNDVLILFYNGKYAITTIGVANQLYRTSTIINHGPE